MPDLTDAELDDLMAAIGLVLPKNRGGSTRKPIAHGSYRGARQHYYRREPLCEECRQAERDYQNGRYQRSRGYLTEEEWQARRAAILRGGAADA